MKVAALLLLVAALALCCVSAEETSCSVKITTKIRNDEFSSWWVGSTRYQIYDVILTNDGTCTINNVVAFFASSTEGGFISEGWNYNITTGMFSGFGQALTAGKSFSAAGFVLANSTSAPVLLLSRKQHTCIGGCNYATTAAPTTSAPSTSAPTTTAPTSCVVSASVVRDNAWWTDAQGKNNSVYRLNISNTGACALKDYVLSFNLFGGSVVSYWNLEAATGGYKVTGFGPTLAPGASFNAAGMILAGAPDAISFSPVNSLCAC